ncbi:hypothetical protein BD324DRAFT_429559 [Kockovaella imperatae]|uniref:SMODS and SLOG-associating 2TM effector domain-containing protein n=1 Tax=Kockovaella imperatae TaxID=4999 RepID=A0A1Y1UGH2_9TREE|nr:hypothetical protein BD324DRAFT_429559 [Kockovaella imperatae]ORX37161.1 hypothetical protein BD324DRAFT_429559 [Kockovaella imperatae]
MASNIAHVPTLAFDGNSMPASRPESPTSLPTPSDLTRRLNLISNGLAKYNRLTWKGLIGFFTFVDVSLAVFAVILGALTAVLVEGHPKAAKWVAVVNTLISAMIALLKGTGIPTSLIALNTRASALRYRIDDLEAQCDPTHESAATHQAHVKLFMGIQKDYQKLGTDLGDAWKQILSGLGPKPDGEAPEPVNTHSDPKPHKSKNESPAHPQTEPATHHVPVAPVHNHAAAHPVHHNDDPIDEKEAPHTQ